MGTATPDRHVDLCGLGTKDVSAASGLRAAPWMGLTP
jgi:hypothetical protein